MARMFSEEQIAMANSVDIASFFSFGISNQSVFLPHTLQKSIMLIFISSDHPVFLP